MGFNAIHIDSAPGVLVAQVLARIDSGALPPGTCLPSQRELAKSFQVGLGSVREAIKILTVMGHLEVIRGKGTYVRDAVVADIQSDAPTDPSAQPPLQAALETALQAVSLADLLQAREIIECGTARQAAQNASRSGVERLERLAADITSTPETIDIYYQNDFAFHLAVAEATDNRALIKMVRLLLERVHHCLGFMNHSLGISLPLNIERCVQTARQVIACILAGDTEQAFSAMGTHLNVVRLQLDRNFLIKEPGTGLEASPAMRASSLVAPPVNRRMILNRLR